jgi:hypothetical protein
MQSQWPMIIGLAVLAALAIAVVLVLLSENDPPETATPTGSPSATPSASAVAATASIAPSASIAPTGLQIGTFVAPVVDGVTLRETATTSGVRIGELPRDQPNLVIEGPVEADGYQWWRLSAIGLPPSAGCITPLPTDPLACPIWYGWAAAGEPDDPTGWFEPAEVECPDPEQDAAAFLELPRRVPLGCYGTSAVSFTAWHPELPEGREQGEPCDADPAVAWLYCPEAIAMVWSSPEGTGFQRLHVDPASGVVVPDPGQWLRITGAFDHPAAAACAEAEAAAAEEPDPDLAVLECRARFVLQGVEVTEAP